MNLEKLLTTVASCIFVVLLIFGRQLGTYLVHAAVKIETQARHQMPIEYELSRAEQMIGSIGPKIEDKMRSLAREEIRIGQLESDLRLFHRQTRSSAAPHLSKPHADQPIELGSELPGLRDALSTQQQVVETLRGQLESMVDMKKRLSAEVSSLAARKRLLDMGQDSLSSSSIDDHLRRTSGIIDAVETRLTVEERVLDLDLAEVGP